MKFTLSIDLGNAAMQTGDDVARALTEVAHTLTAFHGDHRLPEAMAGLSIRDLNGNRVGAWEVKS